MTHMGSSVQPGFSLLNVRYPINELPGQLGIGMGVDHVRAVGGRHVFSPPSDQ